MEHNVAIGVDCGNPFLRAAYLAGGRLQELQIPHEIPIESIAFQANDSISSLGVRFPAVWTKFGQGMYASAGSVSRPIESYLVRLLEFVRHSIEHTTGSAAGSVTVAVPAAMDQSGRAAVQECAQKAGFPAAALIDRATAAAIGYHGLQDKGRTYFVYDFAYANCEFSLVRLAKGRCRVLASGIAPNAGREYLSAVIMEEIVLALQSKQIFLGLKKWKDHQWLEFNEVANAALDGFLEASEIEVTLAPSSTRLELPIKLTLKAEPFRERVRERIEDSLESAQSAFESQGMSVADVDGFLISRQAQATYPVREMLSAALPADYQVLKGNTVALGAALHQVPAELLAGLRATRAPSLQEPPAETTVELPPEDTRSAANTIATLVTPQASAPESAPQRDRSVRDGGDAAASVVDERESGLLEARLLLRDNRYDEAIVLLDKIQQEARALREQARGALALQARKQMAVALKLLETKRYDEAISESHHAYNSAMLDDSILEEMVNIHIAAALKFDRPEEYNDLIRILMCARDHNPKDPRIDHALAERHFAHASVLHAWEQPAKCRIVLQQALHYAPDHAEAKRLLADLASNDSLESSAVKP